MKKFVFLILTLFLFICAFSGCTHSSSSTLNDKTETAYNNFLKNLSQNDEIYYAYKDIDNDDLYELLVLTNTKLAIYNYDQSVKQIGSHDFQTGTLRLFNTNHKDYPGIICFTVGGGAEHYKYLFVQNKQLLFTDLWDLNYSNNILPKENVFCDDLRLVDLAKTAYNNNQDIDFKVFNQ